MRDGIPAMYGIKMTIVPTAAMTFRILPGSLLHIATYPFLPPTTMSGFVRRLWEMERCGDIPKTDISGRGRNPPYYAMPSNMHVLGAFPKSYHIHRTYRQGVRDFKYTLSARLYRDSSAKEVYQLHTWEYLVAEKLCGYVISEDQEMLEQLGKLKNRGAKIGKEGYAFIDSVSDVRSLKREIRSAVPSTFVPGETGIGLSGDIYTLYRYVWKDGTAEEQGRLFEQDAEEGFTPSEIDGFQPLPAVWVREQVEMEYLTDGTEIFVPVEMVNFF